MRKRTIVYFLVIMPVIILATSLGRAQSGLLLGLAGSNCSADHVCTQTLRTLWIAPPAGSAADKHLAAVIKQLIALPDLIVPRNDGFWRVGIRQYCDPPQDLQEWMVFKQQTMFVVPVHEQPVISAVVPCAQAVKEARDAYDELMASKKSDDEDVKTRAEVAERYGRGAVCNSTSVAVQFANPRYLSLADSWSSECGAHPDGGQTYKIVIYDALEKPISVSAALGPQATAVYIRQAKQALVDNANSMHDGDSQENRPQYSVQQDMKDLVAADAACFPEMFLTNPDDSDWRILRVDGRWAATGSMDTHRLCGGSVDFDLPASFVEQLGIHDNAPTASGASAGRPQDLHASGVKRSDNSKDDLFWAPRHDLLIVLTAQEILVFKANAIPPGSLSAKPASGSLNLRSFTLGDPLLTVPLQAGEVPVMAEWALGSSVDRWTTELTSLQQKKLPEPMLKEK